VVWEHLGVQARFVIVWGCLGALVAGVADAAAVPGAATAGLVAVAVVVAVLAAGGGRRGVLALRWRIRPPAPRGGSTVLRRATLRAFGPEVRSGSIPDLIAGSTGDGRERDHHVLAWGGTTSLDADSTAEAGSITKAMTGILLAHLCLTEVVRLDSEVSALLGLPGCAVSPWPTWPPIAVACRDSPAAQPGTAWPIRTRIAASTSTGCWPGCRSLPRPGRLIPISGLPCSA
jgi:hypothetical protein